MRVALYIVTAYVLCSCCAADLDIFKWPTFKDHASNAPNPLESLARLQTKTIKKIGRSIHDFKSRVIDMTTTLFSTKGREYAPRRPSHYGRRTNNGYFKLVKYYPTKINSSSTQRGYIKPTKNSFRIYSGSLIKATLDKKNYSHGGNTFFNEGTSEQSSYSNFNLPSKTSKSNHQLRPVPVSSFSKTNKTSSHEINTPISAAMTIGNLFEDEITNVDDHSVLGKWRPLRTNTKGNSESFKPTTRGGKDLGLCLKNAKELQTTETIKSTDSGEIFLSDEEDKENERILKGARLLSHIVDFALDTLPIENTVNDHSAKVSIEDNSPKQQQQQQRQQHQQNASSRKNNPDKSLPKFISFGSPQENVANIGQIQENFSTKQQNGKDNFRWDGRPKELLLPGQRNNMMFGSLLEELGLTILMTLIRRANLDPMLTTEGGFTIFAPTDSAFKLLPRSVFFQFENDTEKLREVILFHIAPGKVWLEDIRNEMVLASAAPGARMLRLNIYDFGSDLQPVVTVNGAKLRRPDMIASNVIVHVIDKVLFPMVEHTILGHLVSCDIFTGSNVAVSESQLTSILEQEGPFTFFVPSTDAFTLIDNATVNEFVSNISLLQNVLLFHLVPGTYYSEGLRDGAWLPTFLQDIEVQVQVISDGISRRLFGVGRRARVIKADIPATNGVVHILDLVLQPGMETPICGHF